MISRKLLAAGSVGMVLVGFAVFKIVSGKPSAEARRGAAPLVNVRKAERQTVLHSLQFNGDVLPIRQAAIYSKVSGNLDANLVDMGMRVRAGQNLAVIDSTELYQTYQQASATFQNNRMIFERNRQLLERNLVSKQDVDNSETLMKVSQSTYEAAATRLSYARIVAPFAGTITRRFLDAGAYVTPTNSMLFNLMDMDSVKVTVNVLEKDVPLVPQVRRAHVVLDALPEKQFAGIVANYSQAVDLNTRTMAVEVHVANPSRAIKPGMFATVTLVLEERAQALLLPTVSILRDMDGPFVFVVVDKKAKRLRIKTGIDQGALTEIVSGLDGTEDVITTGQQFVKDGGPVAVQASSPDRSADKTR